MDMEKCTKTPAQIIEYFFEHFVDKKIQDEMISQFGSEMKPAELLDKVPSTMKEAFEENALAFVNEAMEKGLSEHDAIDATMSSFMRACLAMFYINELAEQIANQIIDDLPEDVDLRDLSVGDIKIKVIQMPDDNSPSKNALLN